MTTDLTDILTWIPEAADCHFEMTPELSITTCAHPSNDPLVRDIAGEGATPVEAYAQFLARLIEVQDTERERIEAQRETNAHDDDGIELMYACADEAGQMEREER